MEFYWFKEVGINILVVLGLLKVWLLRDLVFEGFGFRGWFSCLYLGRAWLLRGFV